METVNAFLVTENRRFHQLNVYHYVFKKEFSKEEVDKAEGNNLSLHRGVYLTPFQ